MRGRDPRIDPAEGDVLDDDPPLPPLRVVSRVGMAVYGLRDHPGGPIPWQGTIHQWRAEMAGADVMVEVDFGGGIVRRVRLLEPRAGRRAIQVAK